MASRISRPRASSESVVSATPPTSTAKSSYQAYSVTPPSSYRGMRYLEHTPYPKTTEFKSPELTIRINSHSKRVQHKAGEPDVLLPLFGDHDHVPGSITLDPQNCASESGRLTITFEGIFEYVSPMSATKAGPSQITPGRHRTVFYKDSAVIPLYAASEPPSRPTFRSAIATFRRAASNERGLKKAKSVEAGLLSTGHHRSSSSGSSGSGSTSPTATWTEASESPLSSPSASPKTFNFDFELPKGEHLGDDLPPSFSSSNVVSAGVRGRVYAENADVSYRVRALWEALDGSGAQAQLEAPILFQPDTDFQSLDGLSFAPFLSWSESPLTKVDGMPIECAITMPDPASFPRKSSIPYFVVFTTTPRNRNLAAEIMADATIAVSLVRRVAFEKPARALPMSTGSPVVGKGKGKETSGFNIGTSLRTVASSADLRSLRNKRSRGAIPPMPRLDTSAAAISSGSSSSQPSSPSSPGSGSDSTVTSATPSPSPIDPREKDKGKERAHGRLFKRVVKSAPPILGGFLSSRPEQDGDGQSSASASISSSVWRPSEKPLPTIPQEPDVPSSLRHYGSVVLNESGHKTTASVSSFSGTTVRLTDSRTLHTDVSVGFPKRPKGRAKAPGSHPTLESVSSLPDGLYKGSIPLQKGWFPCLQWKGLSIEYFLQVSVIFDNAEFKGQVPLRLY